MTLLARIKAHNQQICGLAWSPDGEQFATGGNDNLCCLFNVERVLRPEVMDSGNAEQISSVSTALLSNPWSFATQTSPNTTVASDIISPTTLLATPSPVVKTCLASSAVQRWCHLAAVKAIAFCPWRPHLLATGGGSNDKMIHFFHTTSGSSLATIAVSAQVTSLAWNTSRREIAATFGYAQPDHAVRIAVFSWPDCRMIGSVKWDSDHRALFAVAYPGGPAGLPLPNSAVNAAATTAGTDRERGKNVAGREGCLIIASSDESVKFQEVWGTGHGKTTSGLGPGMLGGSDIIEMGEGIDKEGDIIR